MAFLLTSAESQKMKCLTPQCSGEGRVGLGDTLTLLDIGKRDRKAINGQKRGLGKEIYDSQGIVITTSFDQNLWSGR